CFYRSAQHISINSLLSTLRYTSINRTCVRDGRYLTARASTAAVANLGRRRFIWISGQTRISCDSWATFPVVALIRVNPAGGGILSNSYPCERIVASGARLRGIRALYHSTHHIIDNPLSTKNRAVAGMIRCRADNTPGAINDLEGMRLSLTALNRGISVKTDPGRVIYKACVGVVHRICRAL